MKKLFILSIACLLAGCTSNVVTLTETGKDGVIRSTRTSTRTFFDANSTLAKSRTANSEKNQTTGVGSYSADSSGSNAVAIVKEAAESFAKGLVEGSK